MLDSVMQAFVHTGDSEITNLSVILSMATATVLGLIIALTYLVSNKGAMNRSSFAITLVMLPIILAVIILFVGSNAARAFSLAGTLSIIRFRSAPGDSKDIGYIFFATATGVGCGVSMYTGSAIFVAVMAVIMLVMEKWSPGNNGKAKSLKITIPESLNYENVFDDVFEKYTNKHTLQRVKTTDLGSLYEASYQVALKADKSEKEFIDSLRVRNGNLNIVLTVTGE